MKGPGQKGPGHEGPGHKCSRQLKTKAMTDHVSMPCATKTKMGNKTIIRKMIKEKNEKKRIRLKTRTI
jgi:hypothetical protein